jgi:hypothetical protein
MAAVAKQATMMKRQVDNDLIKTPLAQRVFPFGKFVAKPGNTPQFTLHGLYKDHPEYPP